MVKKASEAEILEELYDLILSKTLNSKEREVLVQSKNNLEKGNFPFLFLAKKYCNFRHSILK